MGSLIYPEAESEAKKYKEVIDAIDSVRKEVDRAANTITNSILNIQSVTNTDGTLYGQYNDININRAEIWLRDAQKVSEEFTEFKAARNKAYKKACSKYETWSSRIGLEYSDSTSDDEDD